MQPAPPLPAVISMTASSINRKTIFSFRFNIHEKPAYQACPQTPGKPVSLIGVDLLLRIYTYLFAITSQALIFDFTGNDGKQSIIAPYAHIKSRMYFSAMLAHQNVARQNRHPVTPFNA
jgi:hypothetical protein